MDRPIDILLVDDEPANLEALEAILEGPAYRLIRATSGDDALRVLLKSDIAVILLDVQMPGMDGLEVARLIQGTKRFQQIPILFVTAKLLEDRDVVAGYDAGGVDYLTKPFNPRILRHKVAVFADLFRKTRELAELNQTLEARVSERTAELERSEASLRLADQQKDQFLATLAHELRNPLAPLRMGVDLLRARSSDPGDRTLLAMKRQLDHMVRLIDDLLDVARISSGKLQLKKEVVGLASCVQLAIETTRPFLEKRRQHLNMALDGTIAAVADATRITQIVSNLLHNASKFSPEGGQIELSLGFEAGQAQIRIADQGAGMTAEQLGSVFAMFNSGESARFTAQGGLGIGLALSRKLAEMHHGTLTATSAGLGQGSVFTLRLDALRHEDAPPASVPPPARAPGRGGNVLIIEDNRDSAEVLSLWLSARGYQTTIAEAGAEGLTLFEQIMPEIVLCDLGLPGMPGDEVCRQLRHRFPDRSFVMLALTGWGTPDDREKTRRAGFDYHLVKPVEPEALAAILDSIAS